MENDRVGLVLMLLKEGSVGHAIRVYQEEAGVTFGAAKRAVYELARDHGIRCRSRDLLSLWLVALAGLLGFLLSH